METLLRAATQVSFALVLLLSLHTDAYAQDTRFPEAANSLHALFAAEWDYQMEQYPTWASTLGDRRWNDRWSDTSLEAITKRDIKEVIDDVKTDVKVHGRTGSWYRQRLREHFTEVGAGLWCTKDAGVLFYELEAQS